MMSNYVKKFHEEISLQTLVIEGVRTGDPLVAFHHLDVATLYIIR